MDEPLIPTQLPDPETFQRVWKRVMPNQEGCPLSLSPPAQSPAVGPSGNDADLLAVLLEVQIREAAAYQQLARQQSCFSRKLAVLSADCQHSYRQLAAARFLLTGQPYRATHPALPLSPSFPLALRERYLEARQGQDLAIQGSQQTKDPALGQLFTRLAQEQGDRAAQITALLEQLFPAPPQVLPHNSLRCD